MKLAMSVTVATLIRVIWWGKDGGGGQMWDKDKGLARWGKPGMLFGGGLARKNGGGPKAFRSRGGLFVVICSQTCHLNSLYLIKTSVKLAYTQTLWKDAFSFLAIILLLEIQESMLTELMCYSGETVCVYCLNDS